ncbi:hypothetical protein FOC4_g10012507 [Fusarium odoratissimum]|uniref:Uncharacterized protein n=1 Tax=Fusarium oxysporum f. sp. cubense (strain race 4) TaxID=2502994 RepID=N1RV63_FUSC4|nr:hypothetical protein FOC4_g10012507 [Fusarium odoratissimum]
MPYTDAALCTAQPHVGESTVICNLAVTFEDQDVPSSSEDDPVAAELNRPFDEFILAALSRFEVFLAPQNQHWRSTHRVRLRSLLEEAQKPGQSSPAQRNLKQSNATLLRRNTE